MQTILRQCEHHVKAPSNSDAERCLTLPSRGFFCFAEPDQECASLEGPLSRLCTKLFPTRLSRGKLSEGVELLIRSTLLASKGVNPLAERLRHRGATGETDTFVPVSGLTKRHFELPGSCTWELYQWESAIQRFRRRCLDRDGSTRWKNKAGRSGKNLSTGCSLARYASPRDEVRNLNDCKPCKHD
jgi:hypothetical protein